MAGEMDDIKVKAIECAALACSGALAQPNLKKINFHLFGRQVVMVAQAIEDDLRPEARP